MALIVIPAADVREGEPRWWCEDGEQIGTDVSRFYRDDLHDLPAEDVCDVVPKYAIVDRLPTPPGLSPRLTPASMRLLGTAVGDLAEALGGALTSVPIVEPVYVGDGKASIALIVTLKVDDLNAYAAEDAALRVDASDQPWPTEITAEAIVDAHGDGNPVEWRK